ncbi:MAG: hypothetical protein MI921_10845 [Cytophagales bacterium]|nr:hypothetical protein [Cytophagales bacterium]
MKTILVLIGSLISICSFGQEQSKTYSAIVRDGKIDKHVFFLVTNNGNMELDSAELRTISPGWIKALNVVKRSGDTVNDHANASVSTASVFIELKKRHLKKYLKSKKDEKGLSNSTYK